MSSVMFGFAFLVAAVVCEQTNSLTAQAQVSRRVEVDTTLAVIEPPPFEKGLCAVLGLPKPESLDSLVQLCRESDLVVYFQTASAQDADRVRAAADSAKLLGSRLFVERGDWRSVHLADNLVDWVVVSPQAQAGIAETELLRVLRPGGTAILADKHLTKPCPDGVDSWSHPYHGPDNNPLSADQLARAPYRTQFLAEPLFCPMPEVSVAAGGRVFRAFGHIAHKANQNAMLNTLVCVNAYNGTILWQRKLPEGFMIHRNTMIATPEVLYLADHRSCKMIDAATGDVRDEIVIPQEISDGPVWKWMALVDGVLYALVGGKEIEVATQPSQTQGLGHWPWGMWQGHDYADAKTNFGFGRTFVAIDPKTKKVLWDYRQEDYIDSRGVCMSDGRIYFHCPDKSLGCLDAGKGQVVWNNSDADLLEAIGPQGKAQHYVTGYSTTTYIKCNKNYIFLAGPQRSRLVVARTKDGRLLWQKEHGNFQLVLCEDVIYAAGPQQRPPQTQVAGYKLDYETGKVLEHLPMRRACTRATGTADSVFFRASGGTVRLDRVSNTAQHIAPMRPPCHDGVIISDGHLYWGPWMCGCQLSLYGHICLAPAGESSDRIGAEEPQLQVVGNEISTKESLAIDANDWPCYLGDNEHTMQTGVDIAPAIKRDWSFQVPSGAMPTAPVIVDGLTFFGDRNGVVHALDAQGSLKWKAYTGGAVYFPPAIANGRAYVGSADGRVYAFEAATGRLLWTYRVAPGHRQIPVYGKLISTWPASGGVIVQDGTVYAAAGIAHYDGTYVVALDAITGQKKWMNDSSGALAKMSNRGISLQGELFISGDALCFLAGGVHETARFDLKTGRCLNEPSEGLNSLFHTAFYAYYPDYGKYVSLEHTRPDGSLLVYDASYEGSRFSNLILMPSGTPKTPKPASRWVGGRRKPTRQKSVWEDATGRRFTSFVVAPNVLLAAGHPADNTDAPFFCAIDLTNGHDIWSHELPSLAVKGSIAVGKGGESRVALEDGEILCFRPDRQ